MIHTLLRVPRGLKTIVMDGLLFQHYIYLFFFSRGHTIQMMIVTLLQWTALRYNLIMSKNEETFLLFCTHTHTHTHKIDLSNTFLFTPSLSLSRPSSCLLRCLFFNVSCFSHTPLEISALFWRKRTHYAARNFCYQNMNDSVITSSLEVACSRWRKSVRDCFAEFLQHSVYMILYMFSALSVHCDKCQNIFRKFDKKIFLLFLHIFHKKKTFFFRRLSQILNGSE
jgi:hypothetical protein